MTRRGYHIRPPQTPHAAVASALRNGNLKRGDRCEECDKHEVDIRRLHAHHYLGYEPEHWLDIRWLCPSCHAHAHHGYAKPKPPPAERTGAVSYGWVVRDRVTFEDPDEQQALSFMRNLYESGATDVRIAAELNLVGI